jgi:Trypsin-like peptidase domain
MNYYALQNPTGCILFYVDTCNQLEINIKQKNFIEWCKCQDPNLTTIEQQNAIFEKYQNKLSLKLEILDEIFKELGWLTHFVLPTLENKINLIIKSGLLSKTKEKFVLTKIGEFLLKNNNYDDYINSIHYKANFWKLNNVKITDDEGIGSGFFINENTIVTCKHVYYELNNEKMCVEDEEGKKYTILKAVPHPNKKIDIVKLITNEKFNHFTYSIEEEVILTDRVIVFGYPPIPLSSKPFLLANLGEISSIVDNYLDGTDCIILSCILRPGNSGGPIINENGKLVGISTQNRSRKMDMTWENISEMDFNKGLGYATGLCAKYINEF